jgi:ATP-dependent HslUV protease subunit HslV
VDAETIALKSMKVAADLCIYTNHNFVVEKITIDEDQAKDTGGNILSAPGGEEPKEP